MVCIVYWSLPFSMYMMLISKVLFSIYREVVNVEVILLDDLGILLLKPTVGLSIRTINWLI